VVEMVKYGFAYSIGDLAGSGIAYKLAERLDLKCLNYEDPKLKRLCKPAENSSYEIDFLGGFVDDVIYLEYLDQYFKNSDAIIILSRHSSSAAIPSLTVHYPGNPRRDSSHGGKPLELSYTLPSLSTALLRNIYEVANELSLPSGFEISFEATHHGPTSNKRPVIFIEIGSTEKEWRDETLHEAWVKAIEKTLYGKNILCREFVVGFGGSHYSKRFTEMSIEDKYCFGHIISRHSIKELNTNDFLKIALESIERSYEKINLVIAEKKSFTSDKLRVLEDLCKRIGLEVLKI